MKILAVEIYKFKPFRFAGITHLKMTTAADIQLILGDNGCGKSSLLREIHPLPAARPDYEKNGRKVIHLEHNGVEYQLTSDFSSKQGAHSFLRAGVELNISGTTPIQEELVAQHLGYTPMAHAILHHQYRLSDMTKAERKALLLAINPVDLTYLNDRYQRVRSKVKECMSNLKLLRKRKEEIEIQLLSKELLDLQYAEQAQLQDRVSQLSNVIFALNQHLRELRRQHHELLTHPPEELDLPKLKQYCHRVNVFLVECRTLDREHPQEQIIQYARLEQQSATATEQLVAQAGELAREIDTYHEHLNSAAGTISISEIELQIKDYQTLIAQLPAPDSNVPILTQFDAEKLNLRLPTIRTALLNLVGLGQKFWTEQQLSRAKNKVSQLNDWVQHYESMWRGAQEEEARLTQELTKTLLPVRDEVLCEDCQYRYDYVRRAEGLREKLKQVALRRNQAEGKYHRLHKAYTALTEKVAPQREGHLQLQQIYNCLVDLSSYRINFHEILQQVNRLRTGYGQYLAGLIDHAAQAVRRAEAQTKLQELTHQLTLLTNNKLPSVQFLQTLLEEKRARHQLTLRQIEHHQQEQQAHQKTIKQYQNFLRIQTRLTEFQTNIALYQQYTEVMRTIGQSELAVTTCEQLRNEASERLRKIETTLKEQEALLARYNSEVLVLIDKISVEKDQYEEIEAAISPFTGFPYRNMLRYLNNLVHNVNQLLNQFWSYDLRLLPKKEGDNLDFVFPVLVGNAVVTPDMGECSDGQRAAIDLAWTLALILQCRLRDYPLSLDECDREMDVLHKQRLLEWLKQLLDQRYIRQLLMINHSAVLFSGFADSDVLALREENVVVPDNKNRHATLS